MGVATPVFQLRCTASALWAACYMARAAAKPGVAWRRRS